MVLKMKSYDSVMETIARIKSLAAIGPINSRQKGEQSRAETSKEKLLADQQNYIGDWIVERWDLMKLEDQHSRILSDQHRTTSLAQQPLQVDSATNMAPTTASTAVPSAVPAPADIVGMEEVADIVGMEEVASAILSQTMSQHHTASVAQSGLVLPVGNIAPATASTAVPPPVIVSADIDGMDATSARYCVLSGRSSDVNEQLLVLQMDVPGMLDQLEVRLTQLRQATSGRSKTNDHGGGQRQLLHMLESCCTRHNGAVIEVRCIQY